jgi:Tol biopolymer transport system component
VIQTEEGNALVLYQKSGGPAKTIANSNGIVTFAWSLDGNQMVYTVPAQSKSGPGFRDLYLVQPARSQEKKLLATEVILGFFWSPDGRYLAVFKPALDNQGIESISFSQQMQSNKLSLEVIDVNTGETRLLSTFRPTQSFLNVLPFYDQYHHSITIWSPDSREIVITGIDNQEAPGIYVVNAQDGNSKRIATGDLAFWSWK